LLKCSSGIRECPLELPGLSDALEGPAVLLPAAEALTEQRERWLPVGVTLTLLHSALYHTSLSPPPECTRCRRAVQEGCVVLSGSREQENRIK